MHGELAIAKTGNSTYRRRRHQTRRYDVSAIDATTTPTQLSMELGGLVATWKTIQVLETVSDQAQRIRERE